MRYELKDMTDWSGLSTDIAITDPPFGIDFDGQASNYNRDEGNVADGYVEWDKDEYRVSIQELLTTLGENTKDDGQALIFSGWNNSHVMHKEIEMSMAWNVEGKLYWNYNFAPYCKRRPAHNVYEIYWLVKGDEWYYTNGCDEDHCQEGEANLSAIDVNRDYLKEMPKYPTRLPPEIVRVLLGHFTEEGDTVFDPLAGSGSIGIVAEQENRNAVLGDLNTEAKEVFEETRKALR